MHSARYESPMIGGIGQIDNIKYLAEEMAKRKAQLEQENEELKEENVFHKVMFPQAIKHKSQIFVNRNKKKMLNYFSLSKGSSDELDKFKKNLDKKIVKEKRRQSTAQIKDKDFKKSENKIIKNFAHHLSLKSQKDKDGDLDGEDKFYDDGSASGFDSINDYYDENLNEIEEEIQLQDEDEEKNKKENNGEDEGDDDKNIKENEKEDNKKPNNNDNIEIRYANPKEIRIIYAKEITPLNSKENEAIIPKNKNQEKNRYFYDKEMKLLKIKNNKINKKRQILEKKTEDFFEISPFLNKNSMKMIDNNPEYRPINYKPIEVYHYKLAKIELNQNNLKKRQDKEIDIINYNKINKRNFSQSSWDEFVEQEYYWQEEKRKATELLRNQIKKQITYKPNINKNSEIIVKKKNVNKSNFRDYNKNYIFTKLYNDQEKHDNKIKIKREISMPTFKPIINKAKNKNKKIFKGLNNVNSNYKDNNNLSIKTTKNYPKTKLNSLTLDYKTKNKFLSKTPNNDIYKKYKKTKPSVITTYTNNPSSNISPLTSNNLNIPKKATKKKKSINLEYNIDMPDFKNINSKKSKNNQILEENKKENIFLYKEDKISNNNKKKKDITKKIKEEKNFLNEELIDAIKNLSYNKNNKINGNTKKSILYNLNIRDNTSNTIRLNKVLTTNKYEDFFIIEE